MSLFRRGLALLVAASLLFGSSGVARAFGAGATIHCCCGSHFLGRTCRCPDCPVTKRRAPRPLVGDHLGQSRGCSGDGEAAVPVVESVPPPMPFRLPTPTLTAVLVTPLAAAPQLRFLDADRPPP